MSLIIDKINSPEADLDYLEFFKIISHYKKFFIITLVATFLFFVFLSSQVKTTHTSHAVVEIGSYSSIIFKDNSIADTQKNLIQNTSGLILDIKKAMYLGLLNEYDKPNFTIKDLGDSIFKLSLSTSSLEETQENFEMILNFIFDSHSKIIKEKEFKMKTKINTFNSKLSFEIEKSERNLNLLNNELTLHSGQLKFDLLSRIYQLEMEINNKNNLIYKSKLKPTIKTHLLRKSVLIDNKRNTRIGIIVIGIFVGFFMIYVFTFLIAFKNSIINKISI
jgi:hypothetical protein